MSFDIGTRVVRTQAAQRRIREMGLDGRGFDPGIGGEIIRSNKIQPEFYGVRWDDDSSVQQIHETLIEEE